MENKNGVIIKVHVESRNLLCFNGPIKRINPYKVSFQSRVSKTRGYDRRAQLLAYAQKLRHANPQQLQLPFKILRPKPKKWRWAVAMEKIRGLFTRFDGIKEKCKYETIVKEDYSDGEGPCKQERKKKSTKGRRRRIRHSHFCKKLTCLLKKISRAWKSKIGSFDKDV